MTNMNRSCNMMGLEHPSVLPSDRSRTIPRPRRRQPCLCEAFIRLRGDIPERLPTRDLSLESQPMLIASTTPSLAKSFHDASYSRYLVPRRSRQVMKSNDPQALEHGYIPDNGLHGYVISNAVGPQRAWQGRFCIARVV